MSTIGKQAAVQVAGKRLILLEEAEYERLCREAGATAEVDEANLPPLPKADARGRFPALQYARISLARDLIRARKGVGLSQQKLADLTGLRQESISRLETGNCTARPGTVDKIMRAVEARRRALAKKGK